jgi:hypothetical protein
MALAVVFLAVAPAAVAAFFIGEFDFFVLQNKNLWVLFLNDSDFVLTDLTVLVVLASRAVAVYAHLACPEALAVEFETAGAAAIATFFARVRVFFGQYCWFGFLLTEGPFFGRTLESDRVGIVTEKVSVETTEVSFWELEEVESRLERDPELVLRK